MTQQNEQQQRVNHKNAAQGLLTQAQQHLQASNAPFDPQIALQFASVHATIALTEAIEEGNYEPCPNGCGKVKSKRWPQCYDCGQAARNRAGGGYGGQAPAGYGADGQYQGGQQQQGAQQGGDRAW